MGALRAMSLASVLLFAACSGETAKPASASPPANAAGADVAPTPTAPGGAATPPATGSRRPQSASVEGGNSTSDSSVISYGANGAE